MAHQSFRSTRCSLVAGGIALVAASMLTSGIASAAVPVSGSPVRLTASETKIPKSAFSDHTGLTPNSVTVANISTLTAGLFTGSEVGTKAYAAYVNSKGGIHGRKLVVVGEDDGFSGQKNKQLATVAVQSDFAMVGGFSLEDSFGGKVLAANPQMPNVAESLDGGANAVPNSFSPNPAAGGYALGPLVYWKKKHPAAVTHTGALFADYGAAETIWNGEKAAMAHEGYKVVYDPTFPTSQTDFTQNVIAMRNAGVKILFLEQMPENYAASVFQALKQQDFHPTVVVGASTYSERLVPDAGGASAIDGTYLEQPTALYLGEDRGSVPAVSTFLDWVQKTSPGFKADYYTLAGWLSAELFTDALAKAGAHPSRGSVLLALHDITNFTGGHLVATNNPAAKRPPSCYVLSRVENGHFVRVDDPPVTGPTSGYRCDQGYFYPAAS